jgi:DNA-binding response OmpR family regulator
MIVLDDFRKKLPLFGRKQEQRKLELMTDAIIKSVAQWYRSCKKGVCSMALILVVEASRYTGELIKRHLKGPHLVETFQRHLQAKHWLEQHSAHCPDLILIDLEAPEKDADKFVAYVRSRSFYEKVPIVARTGRPDEQSSVSVDCYIAKVLPINSLVAQISDFLLLRKKKIQQR